MSKKNKTPNISFSKIESFIERHQYIETIPIPIKDGEIELHIKRTLTLQEVVEFANSVVNNCFMDIDVLDSEGEATGEVETVFTPYYKELTIGRNILDYYVQNMKSDDNLNRVYSLIASTPIIELILKVIDGSQYYRLIESIDEMIEYRKQQLLNNKQSKLDEVFDNINNLIFTVTDKIDDFDLSSLAEYVPGIAGAVSEGQFDLEKLAKAVLKVESESLEDGENELTESDTKEFENVIQIPTMNVDTETGEILE